MSDAGPKGGAGRQEGTEAHYRDPLYYDQAYRRRRHDVRFYVEECERIGGSVLELGVGTGRVALALARAGISVHGVDLMEPMLERARERLSREPRRVREKVTLSRGDLRDIRLTSRFDLVLAPFNVFMHLYERRDIERALETVLRHLEEGGRLLFDVLLPDPWCLSRAPDRVYRAGHVKLPSNGRRYRYGEAFRYDPLTQVQTIRMVFQDEEDETRIHSVPLAHRQLHPAELEALLHYNGFTIEHHYGGFDRSPLTDASESQVIVAKVRPQSRRRTSQ